MDIQDGINAAILATWRRLPGLGSRLGNGAGLGAMTDEPVNQMIFFAIALGLLAGAWAFAHRLLRAWPAFRAVRPAHKQWYVVANLSKAALLGAQCCSAAWWYHSYLGSACTFNPLLRLAGRTAGAPCAYDVHPLQERWTKTVCVTYVLTDTLALFMVPKLPTSTVLHHVVTTGLLLPMLVFPLASYPVSDMILVYGFWSTLSFPVNAFLALRVVQPRAAYLLPLARASAGVYAVCCVCNWLLHAAWGIEGAQGKGNWR